MGRKGPEAGAEDEQPLVLGGRYAFEADDGFRVVFRPLGRWIPNLAFAIASLAIVGFTLRLLLKEPKFNALAWGIAAAIDFALILAMHIVRKGLAKGPIIVDAAEKLVFLHGEAEIAFDRLLGLRLVTEGDRAELVLVFEEGVVRFGPRPISETKTAADAVARITGLPFVD